MKPFKTYAVFFLTLMMLAVPLVSMSAPIDIVPCGGPTEKSCGFQDLIKLAQNIIKFLIYIGSFIAAIVFMWAGFKLILNPADPGARKEALGMFVKVFWGFVMMLGAWLLVSLIVGMLGYQGVNFLGK